MIVYASPLSDTAVPMTFGSELKRVVQSRLLSTTTRGPLGTSSSAETVRPSATGAPTSLKKSADTFSDRSCSGNPPPVRFTRPELKAETSWTTCPWLR